MRSRLIFQSAFSLSGVSVPALIGPTLLVPSLLLAAEAAAPSNLEEIYVSATRVEKSAVSIPIKVNVFDEQEIRLQQTLSTSPTDMLSKLIPSFSPGR